MATHTPRSDRSWHWPLALAAITLLALALRWYYVSTAMVLNPVRGDATQYYAYAWNLLQHGVFASDGPDAAVLTPNNYRDPGYPFFLALWMKAFGTGDAWYAAVLLCQALLGALTVTTATQLGKHWLPTRWAILAGLLMAVWPHSITINGYLLTETLFGFLCASGLLLCAAACRRASTFWAAAAGLTLGAAALTNAVLLPFGLLLAGFLAWRQLAPRKVCVALAIGALLLPGAWALRNTQIPTPISGSSTADRAMQNLVQGAWPAFHDAYRSAIFGSTPERAQARLTLDAVNKEISALQASPIQGGKAIMQRLSQHPWHYAAWYLLEKPRELWGWAIVIGQGDLFVYPTRNAPFQTSGAWIALAAICRAANPWLMLLALASVLTLWRRHPAPHARRAPAGQAALASVFCVTAFATVVYVALQAEPRYAIPFRPFQLLLATTSLCAAATWWMHHRDIAQSVSAVEK